MYAHSASPVVRLRSYLVSRQWWEVEEQQENRNSERRKVVGGLKKAAEPPKPTVDSLFDEVYAKHARTFAGSKRAFTNHCRPSVPAGGSAP